jgi:hypothetical protein
VPAALDRTTFGTPLADQGVVQEWIAESRVRIEQCRLLVLKAAWLMDTVGNKGAHTEIQAIKITVPVTVEWILEKAIQTYGAAGVSQDTPLARLWAAPERSAWQIGRTRCTGAPWPAASWPATADRPPSRRQTPRSWSCGWSKSVVKPHKGNHNSKIAGRHRGEGARAGGG